MTGNITITFAMIGLQLQLSYHASFICYDWVYCAELYNYMTPNICLPTTALWPSG